jgi:hypothetical protein
MPITAFSNFTDGLDPHYREAGLDLGKLDALVR